MTSCRTLLLAIGVSIAGTVASSAAPLAPATGAFSSASEGSLLQQVHGCHRSARDSFDGWHRHVGPYCDWVPAARSRRDSYARCRTRCHYVGPIKTCKRICD